MENEIVYNLSFTSSPPLSVNYTNCCVVAAQQYYQDSLVFSFILGRSVCLPAREGEYSFSLPLFLFAVSVNFIPSIISRYLLFTAICLICQIKTLSDLA